MKPFFLLLFLSFSTLFAQDGSNQESLKDRFRTGDLSLKNSSAGLIYGFDNSKSDIIGTAYDSEDWRVATLYFYPKTIKTVQGDVHLDSVENVGIRINLRDNLVEVYTPQQTKALPAAMLKKIIYKESGAVLQNVGEYFSNKYHEGFVKLLFQGKNYQLAEKAVVIIKQPDFNPALNTGSKDVRVLKESKVLGIKNKELTDISGKKDRMIFWGEDAEKAEKLMKENNLSPKNTTDLIALFGLLENQ